MARVSSFLFLFILHNSIIRRSAATAAFCYPPSKPTRSSRTTFRNTHFDPNHPIVVQNNDPTTTTRLYDTENDDFDHYNTPKKTTNNNNDETIRKLTFTGVSVSPIGFLALLSTTPSSTLPNDDTSSSTTPKSKSNNNNSNNPEETITLCLRISTDPNDATSSSSGESLTLIQMLSGVDMAGAILPPQLLQHLVALHCCSSTSSRHGHDDEVSEARRMMQQALENQLPSEMDYIDATPWHRGKIRYPEVVLRRVRLELPFGGVEEEDGTSLMRKLNELALEKAAKEGATIRSGIPLVSTALPMKYILECTIDGHSVDIPLFSEELPHQHDEENSSSDNPVDSIPLEEATYTYTPASASFIGLSLALRYKVPITISASTVILLRNELSNGPASGCCISSDKTLSQILPNMKSVYSLNHQSNLVMKNINRGFQANQLQGALRIAMEKGDWMAEEKIREKLKEFDSFEDLPVVEGMMMEEMGDGEGGVLGEERAWE